MNCNYRTAATPLPVFYSLDTWRVKPYVASSWVFLTFVVSVVSEASQPRLSRLHAVLLGHKRSFLFDMVWCCNDDRSVHNLRFTFRKRVEKLPKCVPSTSVMVQLHDMDQSKCLSVCLSVRPSVLEYWTKNHKHVNVMIARCPSKKLFSWNNIMPWTFMDGSANFPGIYGPNQDPTRQKGKVKRVP
jgi:hypothetical protein